MWYAFYPTGLPPFHAGSRIRSALHAVLRHFDPEGDDLPSRHMAVLGHSMGGLITHMLVRNGHGALWRATFTVRPGDLHLDESRRAELSDIFSVRHEPQIQFVAFIGTLHRGSETADSPIGHIGSSLVDLPLKFTSFFLKDQAYLERATDGVVTYDSARFSPQEDEQIIQAGHDVQRDPQAVSYLLDRLRNWKP